MALQISEWVYSGDSAGLIGNTGGIEVKGEGVDARFDYAGYLGITREDAMRQARIFMAALEGETHASHLDKLKALHAELSEVIAKAEGQQ